jgi:hypothetical protein
MQMNHSSSPIDVRQLTSMQDETVARWHTRKIDNPFDGFQATVCQQHTFNFQLWHEEDIARSPNVSDREIARVKRSIDRFNQQRNDWIEKVDDEIGAMLQRAHIEPADDAPLNTETPGSVFDRLSILALRIYHLREQLNRDDVDPSHLESVEQKIAVCLLQKDDLETSLRQLLNEIFAGTKRHRTYRQFKMYNDPTLNPYLYQARKSATA